MSFFKWLFKDAETKVHTDNGELVFGAAAKLRQSVKDSEQERIRKAEEWWERTKHEYLREVIAECEKLAKEEVSHYSFFIRTHEGLWFPEFKDMLRKEGFRVENGSSDQYITIRW